MSSVSPTPDRSGAAAAEKPPPRGAGFWLAYTVGWILYSGLILSAGKAEGASLADALRTVATTALPAAGLGVVVAAWRRDFFRPDRSLLGMAGLHLVTGTIFAAGSAGLTWLLTRVPFLAYATQDESGEMRPALYFLTYAFLYVLLAGFLMWTESIARVQESRTQMAHEAMIRAKLEAQVIRAQFNPHFVFNTLHSLMLLVRAEPDTAERAIEDVASLIRYASRLQREGRDLVPLEEELDFARRYLALEELRLEDRLRVQWEIQEELGEVPVPAFSLQTLLENAVNHGLAPRPSGGTIRVGARREEGRVVLSVHDDGEGAAPGAVTSTEGQGLQLLKERVRVLYGEDGALEWQTEPAGGFQVEIRVPGDPGS